MAIKIKDKGKKRPDDDEQGPEGGGSQGDPEGGLDGFERASFMAAAWIQENRRLFFAIVGLILVAAIGAVIGVLYMRSQQLEASTRLSEGLAAYEVPVENSPELEAIRQEEDIPEPSEIHETEGERWQAVLAGADSTLEDFDRGSIAMTARMTKAAASLNLGNYEEAESVYRQVVDSEDAPDEVVAAAYAGLAKSVGARGELEEAEAAWSEFADRMPERSAYADFEMARLVERHGDPSEAEERYQQFLEDYPDSDYVDEVERRKALLS